MTPEGRGALGQAPELGTSKNTCAGSIWIKGEQEEGKGCHPEDSNFFAGSPSPVISTLLEGARTLDTGKEMKRNVPGTPLWLVSDCKNLAGKLSQVW